MTNTGKVLVRFSSAISIPNNYETFNNVELSFKVIPTNTENSNSNELKNISKWTVTDFSSLIMTIQL